MGTTDRIKLKILSWMVPHVDGVKEEEPICIFGRKGLSDL